MENKYSTACIVKDKCFCQSCLEIQCSCSSLHSDIVRKPLKTRLGSVLAPASSRQAQKPDLRRLRRGGPAKGGQPSTVRAGAWGEPSSPWGQLPGRRWLFVRVGRQLGPPAGARWRPRGDVRRPLRRWRGAGVRRGLRGLSRAVRVLWGVVGNAGVSAGAWERGHGGLGGSKSCSRPRFGGRPSMPWDLRAPDTANSHRFKLA